MASQAAITKIGVVIPAYNNQPALDCVLQQLENLHHLIVVVDDGSDPPLQGTIGHFIRHDKNRGYGAAQKTGFEYCLHHQVDAIALIHGDNQYHPQTILAHLALLDKADVILGSRMLINHGQDIPTWRRIGNRTLTTIANQVFGSRCTDLHTGARIYSRVFLGAVPYSSFSDNFVFDQQMLVWGLTNNITLMEFPIPPKYDHTVSSISFRGAVRYGFGCLREIYRNQP